MPPYPTEPLELESYGLGTPQPYPWGLPEELPKSASSLALSASLLVCSGAGRLYGFGGFNNKGSAQFILAFDVAAVPATGTVPVYVLTAAASSNFGVYWGSSGRWFDRGIVLANSSTAATLTGGSADCWFDAQYTPQVI